MKWRKSIRFVTVCLTAAVAMAVLPGCATPKRLSAVPVALQDKAEIPGLSGVRYRVGVDDAAMAREGIECNKRELAYLAASGHKGPLPPAVALAVSGGGDKGAFGAGLLNGWTAAGDRPEFKLVTGISTGALIAPFAFMGPKYDETLKEVYTKVSPKDIADRRNILAAIFSDAMADNAPLWRLIEKHVHRQLLDAIAAEYNSKGRLLLVGTTDLDAQQPVIWNMTKIATSRDPKALELFRTIMIASAAIPGAFPPVMIDVLADGGHYQEMHVDGGAMTQVFIYPPSVDIKEVRAESAGAAEREKRLYVIRNSRLDPEWSQVERQTMSIAGRAISSLIQTQGIGDLDRIYLITQRDGVDFNLAYVPASFNAPHKEDFDTEYMRRLFALGYEMAAKGYPWQKAPPGFAPGK
ncbi:MAG TPA: patatin-like phospholipase family protein [Geobacteraceae bacterium]|nr:patatin-like phospholipase family protein [Geobacteraceae bacterium]